MAAIADDNLCRGVYHRTLIVAHYAAQMSVTQSVGDIDLAFSPDGIDGIGNGEKTEGADILIAGDGA